jgi:hypothetical protein
MSPRLPLASRQDILDELADIQRERDTIVGTVGDRADEQRACLDWWEQDLEEQLQEMSAALTITMEVAMKPLIPPIPPEKITLAAKGLQREVDKIYRIVALLDGKVIPPLR